jgi:hypothetical protein
MLLAMAVFSVVGALILVPEAATKLASFTWIIAPLILTVVPAFFIIAGYLASSLLMRAKAKAFVISRTKRLLPILFIAGAAGYLMHIWVHLLPIWYLAFCSLIALTLSSISRKVSFAIRSRLSVYTNLLSFGPVAVGVYGILVAPAVGAFTGIKLASLGVQSLALAYNWRIGIYCYLAFSMGWMLQRSGSTALKKLANCTFIYLCLGGVLMSAASSLPAFLVVPAAITAGIYFAFGAIGGCLALCSRQIRLFRYLADAGLWVYSVQPILAALLLAVVAPTPAFLGSVLVAFATYQFVIRKTVLGRILAGRRRL